VDDETDWSVLKPEIFATIMDFFSSGAPLITADSGITEDGALELTHITRRNMSRPVISST
jgi:hypothetical protein